MAGTEMVIQTARSANKALREVVGPSMTKGVFLFDGDCAFCSSSARLLIRLIGQTSDVIPFQRADLKRLGVRLEDAQSAVQYLSAEERYQGALAIAKCLIDSRKPAAFLGWFIKTPVILSFAELIYTWVAKNRHKLPGGTPACQLKD